MKIVVVGTGNVASHLTPALCRAGFDAEMVPSRNIERLPAAQLYVVAVRDDALDAVVAQMRPLASGPIVHTAGSKAASAADGVLYPMQTFTKGRAVDFSTVHFFVEAESASVLGLLEQVAAAVGTPAHVHRLDSEGRRRLHLAAVFACNFVNHCCALAEDVLRPLGLPFDVMLPLLDETVSKLHHLPPREAQTGPAIRHDHTVLAAHHHLLSQQPRLQAIYDQLSASISAPASPGTPTAPHPANSAPHPSTIAPGDSVAGSLHPLKPHD